MDARVAGNVTQLQRGVIDQDLVRYASSWGMDLKTLQLVLAHLLAEIPLVEVSQATGVDQEPLNRLIYYRWWRHVWITKKPRPAEPRSGNVAPISAAQMETISELL